MARPSSSLSTVLLCAALATGCAAAPVQEMSDARQALRAAQAAGAAERAPDALGEAERLIGVAQENLRRHEYREARRNAEQAREAAVRALATARSAPAGA